MHYCFPQCESLYHKAHFYDLTQYPGQWNLPGGEYYNQTSEPKYLRHFWDKKVQDPRHCFKGRYCWSCFYFKWPGYEPDYTPLIHDAVRTVSQADVDRHSRGRLMIFEKSDTEYGVSMITNQKTHFTMSNGGSRDFSHHYEGFIRTSFTDMHVQSDGANREGIKFYDYADLISSSTTYTTTENQREHMTNSEALYWPKHERIFIRQ